MRKLLVAAFAALVLCAPAQAARHDKLPLHVGSAGPNVCELKFLLRSPRPRQNVFRQVKGLYKGSMCSADPSAGYFGESFGKLIYAYKFRLGYPARYNLKTRPVAGAYFFALLRGRRTQTKEMVALAARRLRAVEPGVSALAEKIRQLALSQLGVREIPGGSNRGPRISYPVGAVPSYESSTGQYGAAWCMSFVQWLLQRVGYGTIADRSAGVIYTEDWAKARRLLNAKAKVGSLVAFLDDGGHIGYIVKILGSGYVTVEGNSGDAVREVFHPWNSRLRVFINLPRIA